MTAKEILLSLKAAIMKAEIYLESKKDLDLQLNLRIIRGSGIGQEVMRERASVRRDYIYSEMKKGAEQRKKEREELERIEEEKQREREQPEEVSEELAEAEVEAEEVSEEVAPEEEESKEGVEQEIKSEEEVSNNNGSILDGMTLKELRKYASSVGIKGASKMNTATIKELIEKKSV